MYREFKVIYGEVKLKKEINFFNLNIFIGIVCCVEVFEEKVLLC